jgi:hypothetical protein
MAEFRHATRMKHICVHWVKCCSLNFNEDLFRVKILGDRPVRNEFE